MPGGSLPSGDDSRLQIDAQPAGAQDVGRISRQMTHLIQEVFDCTFVAIFTLHSNREALLLQTSAGKGLVDEQGYAHLSLVNMGEGIIGQAALTGQEILANDTSINPHYRHITALSGPRSEFALPLKIDDRLLGVLDVQSDQPGHFTERDQHLLRALAGNIAIAVEGANLYVAAKRRSDQLAAIYEVSNAITSILDQEKLLNEVVELIHNRFGYPFVHLFSVHPGRGKIFYEAGSGARSQTLQAERFSYDLDDSHGLIPWVARRGETLVVNDVNREPRYRPSPHLPEATLSELTVPLVYGGQVLGVLDVQSDHLDAFGEEDRFLFETLADNIAIALRNASLYRSEIWRRQVAEGMREVAGLLSADADLEGVLNAILTELERSLPLELAAIWLASESVQHGAPEGSIPVLHLAALRGECAVDLDLEVGMSPEDVLTFNPPPSQAAAISEPFEWLQLALQAQQPVIRTLGAPYDPLTAILDFPANHSAIAAPLRIGQDNLGVLTLAHRTSGRYGSEAQAMTAAFASYAAVGIENTRLYESAHEQAWVSTVLLQVAEATQALTDLGELLDTVIRIAPTLIGVRACLLYLKDDHGTFLPTVASGLSPEQQIEFERVRFGPGDSQSLDRMVANQVPVVLRGLDEDRNLIRVISSDQLDQFLLRSRLVVLVPLLARGEVIGAFLIDYSVGNQELEAILGERLAIIQGIAHQTAMAIENIRLFRAQKEEAYVSVALLQVAQAVVSSKDLDEALESIVRITPILAGVERAVTFLWDKGHTRFQLSASYGITHQTRDLYYASGEFPFLDAVYESDRLLAYPLEGDEELFTDVPDDWAFLIPPDPQEVEFLLAQDRRLLLAFPLSVKGEVLGVLLIEEPLPSAEGVGESGVSPRLRAKRLEIITGISQQAALAIQNEILQHEMLTRERLEREVQLARQIQISFLPQELPDLPGWDLKICWRTAREVGGDYYDFFELPGGRLGLVIADVADKGMPAALFMTLVRTLLRAIASQHDSPADVLERVNDSLVPDAPQGMFVTLFYAVLDLESGEMEFANAGHNPPLLARNQVSRLEYLEWGDMALGVQEGNIIHNHRLTLGKGDYLVMYTDGVTEAISPQGDLFDPVRLKDAITSAVDRAVSAPMTAGAQIVLESIDRSVNEFIGEGSRSDDLTLMILRRLI